MSLNFAVVVCGGAGERESERAFRRFCGGRGGRGEGGGRGGGGEGGEGREVAAAVPQKQRKIKQATNRSWDMCRFIRISFVMGLKLWKLLLF